MGRLTHLVFMVPKGSIARKTKIIMRPPTTQGDTMPKTLTPEEKALRARYCEKCGEQINGKCATGHKSNCKLNK